MARLLACPFCHALHPEGETDGSCPVCGVPLQPMDKLPPSYEVQAEEAAERERVPLEDRPLPWTYLGRMRGALLLLSAVGLVAFFMPWVVMTKPDLVTLSGFDLARGRAGWLWGGAVGWFVMLPLVASRRTVAQLRGVRMITALFACVTLGEGVMLMSLPPHGTGHVPIAFDWGWGLYASLATALLGVACSARLGGRLDDLARSFPADRGTQTSAPDPGPRTLH